MANRDFPKRMGAQRTTEAKKVGIEKFRFYAEPRGIFLNEASYGLYRVVSHSGKTSQREAVRAAVKDEEGQTILGWVINLANRQRKFVADGDGWNLYPLGKKHLPKEGLFTGTAVPVQVEAIPTIHIENGKVVSSGIALGVEL